MKQITLCLLCLAIAVDAGTLTNIWKKKNENFRTEAETTTEQVPRIIGGEPTDIKFFPYQLSVRHFDYHICGASIIAGTYALSLASCVDFIPPEQITLLAGVTDVTDVDNGLLTRASQFMVHPDFNSDTYNFDIVIIEVKTPFKGENIQPVRLATQNMPMYEGLEAVVAGWGDTNDVELRNILHKVDLPIVGQYKCSEAWNGQITETSLCAGKAYLDTCSSDNGGAIVYCGLQVGINVRNSEQCDGSKPAVFTSIAHPSVRSFIREKTGV